MSPAMHRNVAELVVEDEIRRVRIKTVLDIKMK
jgi:hypothetical protein